MKPLQIACQKLSKRAATISEVIPLVNEVKFSLNSLDSECSSLQVSEFVSNMILQLNRVLDLKKLKNNPLLYTAIFLDPRLIDLCVDDIGPIADFVANYVKVANVRNDIDTPQANPIDSRRTKLLAKKVKTTGNLNEIESELEAYQKLTADDKIEPFEFWKQNEKIFKNSWECIL